MPLQNTICYLPVYVQNTKLCANCDSYIHTNNYTRLIKDTNVSCNTTTKNNKVLQSTFN